MRPLESKDIKTHVLYRVTEAILVGGYGHWPPPQQGKNLPIFIEPSCLASQGLAPQLSFSFP